MKLPPAHPPIHTTLGGLRSSTLPNGVTVGAKPTTNYDSRSQSFQQMNALVVQLDSLFDSYSLAVQDTWNITATTYYPTTPICGCPAATMTGKKLHRLQNFPAGPYQTPSDTPNTPRGSTTESIIQINWKSPAHGFIPAVIIHFQLGGEPILVIWGLGKGLNNLQTTVPDPPITFIYLAGTPEFDAFYGVTNQTQPWCIWETGPTTYINSGTCPVFETII